MAVCAAASPGTGQMVRVGPEAVERALAEPHLRPMQIAGFASSR